MNCELYSQQLSAYLDNDLTAEEAQVIVDHLEECTLCRDELESYTRLEGLVQNLPSPAPSDSAVLQIKRATPAGSPSPIRTEFGPVLNLDDLAAYLRIDRATAEAYIGEIPCFELGGRILFRKSVIEKWIEKREQAFAYQQIESDINSIIAVQDV